MRQCSNCRVWKRKDNENGQCRKNAPLASEEAIGNGALWPITSYDDWCGDYEQKESRPPESLPNGNVKEMHRYNNNNGHVSTRGQKINYRV